MLGSSPVGATIPVTDLERSILFYRDVLGLAEGKRDPSPGIEMKAGSGTSLYLYQRGPSKADHTLAGFWVADLEKVMGGLREKGVQFEEYDMPGLKTVNGVADMGGAKGCWFKDPDGNILSIGQDA